MNDYSLITKFSLSFISKYRITLLLLLATVVFGGLVYTSFLKREGFPAVDIPVVFIEVSYFVEDIDRVDEDITIPIERAISRTSNVSRVRSSTTDNFANIVVEFSEGFSAEEGVKLLKEDINSSAILPEAADVQYRTVNAGSLDGVHDLIFTLSGDASVSELQNKAQEVAGEIEKLRGVVEANPLNLVTTYTNPASGEEIEQIVRFNRVGMRQNDSVEFKPAIAIGVIKQEGLDALEISDIVRDEISRLEERGSLEGFNVFYGGDLAGYVRGQIESLEKSALTGIIALIVILFFLINWRASLITAIFMPTVMAAVFVTLYFIGYSLNIISLFALILVLGLLVDDAIVVVEAIDYQIKKGKRGLAVISGAMEDIGPADVMGTLTTLLVFAPMLFVSGLLGEFIRLIPVTVMVSLALSLVIALTFIPFLSYIFLSKSISNTENKRSSFPGLLIWLFGLIRIGIDKTRDATVALVNRYLHNGWALTVVIGISLLMVVGGILFSTKLSFSVFPAPDDTDSIVLSLTFENAENVQEAEELAIAVEEIMIREAGEYIEEVHYHFANRDQAFIGVELIKMNDRTITSREIVSVLRGSLENIGGVRVKIEQESAGPPTSDFQFVTQIFSDDIDALIRVGDDLEEYLLQWQSEDGTRVTEVVIDNINYLAKLDGNRYIEVKGKISDPENTRTILALRENVEAYYTDDRLKNLGLESDAIAFDLGQEGENIESFQSTLLAFGIAIFLMYGLLVFQFDSFLQPFLILLAVPLTFPGLFPGLFLTDHSLSFFVMLGVIALSGIVVNNTIMLVDFANKAKSRVGSSVEAITEALRARFRPIIVTSLTTIAGIFPLAITDPFWEPLTYTIIFGLISSTILVILVFPAYYLMFERVRDIKRWLIFKIK